MSLSSPIFFSAVSYLSLTSFCIFFISDIIALYLEICQELLCLYLTCSFLSCFKHLDVVITTVLLSLCAYSNICVGSGLVSVD